MKATMKLVQWVALAVLGLLVRAVFLEPAMALPADVETGVPFSFDNREVNAALVALYENDPAIWKPEQLFLIGMCYIFEQRLDEALAVFEKLHAQAPSNPRFLTDLGAIHHMKGELDEAEGLYQQAWRESRYVTALKQLAALQVQTKGSASFSNTGAGTRKVWKSRSCFSCTACRPPTSRLAVASMRAWCGT